MLGKILFVCIGNTCRSVLAEHIFRNKHEYELVVVESAGSCANQENVSAYVIEILKDKYIIDVSKQKPVSVTKKKLKDFFLIICLDKMAFDSLNVENNVKNKLVFWDIEDPWGKDLEDYMKTFSILEDKISQLNPSLKHLTDHVTKITP
ncbi:low molecular weight phosphatase family protein [Haliscomenobacter hydrossis]|uniref:Protein tyrosine phosphatase n=1 Tax=Haliscomenobacter hydrossis (strain ATCC 27775 / DSM 1100 / LMG 10767 / O) TaxID=760192 RepID=F4KR55_HALH1|nr:low molecular weight phosphatase family protein [Haliscomenobacter hydrossis]AEE53293.1 protein tyrosine phosphatase [Haliscomenobacter hydrossis DSM 1100]